MADQQNLGALLAALTGQQQRPNTQQPHPSAMHAQLAQNIAAAAGLGGAPPQQAMPQNFGLPQPTSSGSLDLSNIKPTNSRTVSFADAIARAKSIAAERGVSAYRNEQQQPPRFDDPRGGGGSGGGGSGGGGGRSNYGRRSRSRSRSPGRRDTYRDGYNPYRDERRGRNFERERSYSPPRRNAPYSPPPNRGYGARGGAGGGGGGGGGGGAAKERGNPDSITEPMHIESGLVGLIIGRGGETLRRVEQETGARVQFVTSGDHRDAPERLCNITGTRQQVGAARQQIQQIIEDNAKSTGGGSSVSGPSGGSQGRKFGGTPTGLQHNQTPLRGDSEDALQIMVPDRTVGLIIGRGGETIRDLQERSGCHINIVGEQKSVNGLRPVNLIGSQEAAKRAKDLIMEIVDSDIRSQAGGAGPAPSGSMSVHSSGQGGGGRDRGHGNVQGGYYAGGGGGGNNIGGQGIDKVAETIRVPIDAVGMIIGKGGETIKEMQSSTGCRINVSSQFHPSDVEREISLQGPRDAILRARKAIEEKVEASQKKHTSFGGDDRGGRGGGRGGNDRDRGDRGGHQHNDYNNDHQSGGGGGGYGQQHQQHQQQQQHQSAAVAAAAPASTDPAAAAADPYAPWGGYQNYLAMYYAMIAQQPAGGAAPGAAAPGAPGTT